jgi:hypothetical protein
VTRCDAVGNVEKEGGLGLILVRRLELKVMCGDAALIVLLLGAGVVVGARRCRCSERDATKAPRLDTAWHLVEARASMVNPRLPVSL